jgi:hypothetical protein
MFKFLLGILFISALVMLGTNLVGHLSISSKPATLLTYAVGDFVQIKLTGDVGMVTEHLWRETYMVTLKDYSTKMFHDFELTPADGRGMIEQPGSGMSPSAGETPNTIFTNEKVWNPQTQRYE